MATQADPATRRSVVPSFSQGSARTPLDPRAILTSIGEVVYEEAGLGVAVARDARLAGVIFGDQAGREIDVRIRIRERRIGRNLVAAHRDQAHRLGAARDNHAGSTPGLE